MTTLDDYLDFNDLDGIRLNGHRIWLHDLLYEVVFNYRTVEELTVRFPSLRLDEIYACLLYYETHRQACLQQLAEHLEGSRRNFESHAAESRETMEQLRRRKFEQLASSGA